jgi:hypothetical protein
MPRALSAGAVALVAVLLTLVPARAFASADAATAEALFEAGRDALESGDYETACAKFGESQRLDPAAGTLMNLAACNEKRGRLASAWENWREAQGTLRPDDERLGIVGERLAALEARLPRLVIVLSRRAPADTVVARDESALGPAALGLPLPVDPGTHEVRVTASGFEPRVYRVNVEEGKTLTVSVEPGPPQAVSRAPAASPRPAPRNAAAASSSSARTWAVVSAGTGAAFVVTGAVTGLLALDLKSEVEARCTKSNGKYLCDTEGVHDARRGKTYALLSSIALPTGVALAALGATLWFTAGGEAAAVSVAAARDGLDVSARGAF